LNPMKDSDVRELTADVVVAGGGGSGLAAAIAAAEKGAKVIVIEKRRTAGGNSVRPRGIFAADSHIQKRLKIEARRDDLFKMAMADSHWRVDGRIMQTFINKSADTIRWMEEKGVRFSDVPHFLPNQVPRIFHLMEGRGSAAMRLFVKRCGDLGVRILLDTAARQIVTDDRGEVAGLIAATKDSELHIRAKAVIIATGGYGGNKELLKKYYPYYTDDLINAGLPHMGEGLQMATGIGAATEGLGNLLLRGPYFKGSLEVVTVAMEPSTIWVNRKGERFTDETVGFHWPNAANALNQQPGRICYSLFDEKLKRTFVEEGLIKGYNRFAPNTKMIELDRRLRYEASRDRVKISGSWSEIAEWMGAKTETLENTITTYNASAQSRLDGLFFKQQDFLHALETPPFYAAKCYQGFYNTIGGIKINHHMEVVDPDDNPIPGCYAAGTDTGGWETETYCLLLSANAFGFAVNSGRIAGENASAYAGHD
jgi:fumarate reductase flavoprotein subunit